MGKETCPHCGHIVRFEDALTGGATNCDRCGGTIVLSDSQQPGAERETPRSTVSPDSVHTETEPLSPEDTVPRASRPFVFVGGIACVVAAALTLATLVHALRSTDIEPSGKSRADAGERGQRGERPAAATEDSDSEDPAFTNDPEAIGAWEAVDFVSSLEQAPAPGDRPERVHHLKELYLFPGGRSAGIWRWTKERVVNTGDGTSASYTIREAEGATYLYLAWNSSWSAEEKRKGYLVFAKKAFDAKSVPALFDAAKKGDVARLRKLLAMGADVNAANNSGVTALHLTALHGQPDAARVLLKHGALVASADRERRQPLHRAAQKGQRAVANVLLDAGAELDALDNSGMTPLHLAASNGHQELAHMLAERGANIHVADDSGKSPVEWMAELAE